jgi:GT2 family glycosyltransferase
MTDGRSAGGGLWSYTAVVATFRRATALEDSLRAVIAQSAPPTRIVVVDNDPEGGAKAVVERLACDTPGSTVIEHLPMGANTGPAHAWWAGCEHLRTSPDRGDWLLVLDDDDPLAHPEVIHRLLEVATSARPDAAGVGLRGAVLVAARARLQRRDPSEGSAIEVDYLASGGAPLYRWSAIDEVGFFDPDLFFGFEDLDLGLRLRQHDWTLVAAPQPSLHRVADTATGSSAGSTEWREYYKSRALVHILKTRVGRGPALVAIGRSTLAGSVALGVKDRSFARPRARLEGALDGWRGRMGPGDHVPSTNPVKPAPRLSLLAVAGRETTRTGNPPTTDGRHEVDVIVPCHDVADTLALQLDALVAERAPIPWGIVVVDNRSSDGTAAVAARYADRGVRVVDAPDRAGVAHARNVGVRSSSAPRLLICDGDDIVWPGWVAAMADALDTSPVVGGRVEAESLNSAEIATSRPMGRPGELPRFGGVSFVPGGNCGIERSVFEHVGGFDEDFVGLEDIEFALRIAAVGVAPVAAPGAVIAYRLRSGWGELWRQGIAYGRGRPELIRRARASRLPAPSRFEGWRSWAWLVVRSPRLVTASGRRQWVWVFANRVGVLRGAWAQGAVYL